MGLLRARASCVSIAAYAAASGTAADRCAAAAGPLPYTLLARAQQSPDSVDKFKILIQRRSSFSECCRL